MLAIAVTVWAARLGSFLVRRVVDVGSDRRFNDKAELPMVFNDMDLAGDLGSCHMGATLAVLGGKAGRSGSSKSVVFSYGQPVS